MDGKNNITIASTTDIIDVVRTTLSYIDPRLIEHGERVSFIANEIISMCPNCYGFERTRLFLLCALHDIGAYKTEEIANMVEFETKNSDQHAVYGYLFMKHMTAFGDYARTILYHHTPYADYEALDFELADYSQLIFLADRIDILVTVNREKQLERVLTENAGKLFNPQQVEYFLKAERARNISGRLISGAYREDVAALIGRLDLSIQQVMECLKMLVLAIDFRSVCTVSHTANTTTVSVELARLMGLDDATREKIYLGAYLHDVGKIATPVEILEKPGALTAAEMDVMRQHVVTTEEIIRGVVSDEICDIAARHHEKLDGSGYPNGLGAEELTLPQRIVAVADIYSALMGKRSYKEAFPKEKALAVLGDMAEKGQLDPDVCRVFITNYNDIARALKQSTGNVERLYETVHDEYIELMTQGFANTAQ